MKCKWYENGMCTIMNDDTPCNGNLLEQQDECVYADMEREDKHGRDDR